MTEWLRQNSPWAIPLAFAVLAWIIRRVELVLIQVRKTNGRVNIHDEWIENHETTTKDWTERISGLENRERQRLQAEVVASRMRPSGELS